MDGYSKLLCNPGRDPKKNLEIGVGIILGICILISMSAAFGILGGLLLIGAIATRIATKLRIIVLLVGILFIVLALDFAYTPQYRGLSIDIERAVMVSSEEDSLHRQLAVEGTVQGRLFGLAPYVLVFVMRDGEERGHLQILDSTLPVSKTWSWSGEIPIYYFEDFDTRPLEIAVWLMRASEVGSGAFTMISEAHQVIERLD